MESLIIIISYIIKLVNITKKTFGEINMNNVWNNKEREFIRQNVEKYTDEVGATKLSEVVNRAISMASYRKQRQKLGLRKQCGRGISKLVKGKK